MHKQNKRTQHFGQKNITQWSDPCPCFPTVSGVSEAPVGQRQEKKVPMAPHSAHLTISQLCEEQNPLTLIMLLTIQYWFSWLLSNRLTHINFVSFLFAFFSSSFIWCVAEDEIIIIKDGVAVWDTQNTTQCHQSHFYISVRLRGNKDADRTDLRRFGWTVVVGYYRFGDILIYVYVLFDRPFVDAKYWMQQKKNEINFKITTDMVDLF